MPDDQTVTVMETKFQESRLQSLLAKSAARHSHLCPRQVLGVRMGLAGMEALHLSLPIKNKRLLVIVETDGCFTDGIEVTTGVTVGHRTLRVEDYGKTAATFIDTITGEAIRIGTHPEARYRAWDYATGERRHYFAQLAGYQIMPEDILFTFQSVKLTKTLKEIISRPGVRTSCDHCGEEIVNEREIVLSEQTLCQACSGSSYYVSNAESHK